MRKAAVSGTPLPHTCGEAAVSAADNCRHGPAIRSGRFVQVRAAPWDGHSPEPWWSHRIHLPSLGVLPWAEQRREVTVRRTLTNVVTASHRRSRARHPDRWRLPRPPRAGVPVGVALVAAVVILGGWLSSPGTVGPDRNLIVAVQQWRSTALDVAALVLRYGLSIPVATGGLLLVGIWLWAHDRHLRRAVVFVALVVPGWLVTGVVKAVVERPRPVGLSTYGQLEELGPHSFPSAHAAIGAGAACAVVVVFCWHRSTTVRVLGAAGGLFLAVVAGWSRVYLGVHHPGDVLGSVLLTAGMNLICWPVLARWPDPRTA